MPNIVHLKGCQEMIQGLSNAIIFFFEPFIDLQEISLIASFNGAGVKILMFFLMRISLRDLIIIFIYCFFIQLQHYSDRIQHLAFSFAA